MGIKSLIRKIFRATVTAVMCGEREVIDLTVASREPSVEIIPAPMSAKSAGGRSPSRTLSPLTKSELPATRRQVKISKLTGGPASYKGKGPRRSPPPVMMSRGKVEEVAGSSRTATAEARSRTVSERPATPERNGSTTTASSGRSSIKKRSTPPSSSRRGLESRSPIVIKEEDDSDSNPPTPIKKYEDSDSDHDEIEISPAVKRYASPGFGVDLSRIPFQRSSSPSPMSRAGHPGPAPVYHPDFPTRPPLKCPMRNTAHNVIQIDLSKQIRSLDRQYYKCADCPKYGAFICWADADGVKRDNPRCKCGYPSREDITGDNSQQPDTLWYKCATDACKFRRFDWDDPLTPEQVNQYCGRDVYPM
ncbi:hypothetical protein GGS26DRAFT_593832 [Hypomontagnella submonticulosa]|nr:hypothetical protein GGS26DRAFT_593832 [Hypomontagnella submonticulosa]